MAKYTRPKRTPLPGQVAVPDPVQARKRKIAPVEPIVPAKEPVEIKAEDVKPAAFFKKPKDKK